MRLPRFPVGPGLDGSQDARIAQSGMPERRHSGITAFRLTSLPELWRDRWPAIWYSGIMNVSAIANQKGGTGKTTSAAAFAVLLSRCGIATHLVDMDPQASLSAAFGHVDPGGRLFEALACRSSLPITRVASSTTAGSTKLWTGWRRGTSRMTRTAASTPHAVVWRKAAIKSTPNHCRTS